MTRSSKVFTLAVAVVLVLAACGSESSDTTAASTTSGAPATTAPSQTTAAPATTTAPATTAAPATTSAPATTLAAGTSADAAAFSKALAATQATNSGRMEGRIEMTGVEDALQDLAFTFFGEFDNAASTFRFVIDMSALANAGDEEIPPEFAAAFGEMETLQIGEQSYMKFGLFSFLGVTTEWVAMPPADAAGTAGSFGTPTPTDPLEFLEALDNGEIDIVKLGSETIRGTATTQYRLTVDPDKLRENATPEELEALDAQGLEGFGGLVPIDVWIDDDGLIHRYVMAMTPSGDEATDAGFASMTMTLDLFDHGDAIIVTAPDPANVTDLATLGGLGGLGGFTP